MPDPSEINLSDKDRGLDNPVAPEPQRYPNRLGGPMDNWRLFEPRINLKSGKSIGVRTPKGEYFAFSHGEEIVFNQDGNTRKPFISLADGTQVVFEAWRASRREHIRPVFEQANPLYGSLYMRLLEDFPELEQLDVRNGNEAQQSAFEFTGGVFKPPDKKGENPYIIVDMNGEQHYQKLLQEREVSARVVAKMLNLDFSVLQQNPQILALFIFAHEMGHGYEYLLKYAQTAEPKEEANKESLKQLMTLPIPGANPIKAKQMYKSGELQKYYKQYEAHYKQNGIFSPEQLLTLQEQGYRNLPKENFADVFAAQALNKHRQILGIKKAA